MSYITVKGADSLVTACAEPGEGCSNWAGTLVSKPAVQ